MTQETRNMVTEEIRKMIPNILLLVAIWWIGTTNQKNDSVARMEVSMTEVVRRLEKIEQKVDDAAEISYSTAYMKEEIQRLQKRVQELER